MKSIKLFIYLIFYLLVSCNNNEPLSLEEFQSTKWKVIKIASEIDFSYNIAINDYYLMLNEDSTFLLMLDVNDCMGIYKFYANGEVLFEMGGCTEVCCDSEFAENLAELLSKMHTWNLSDDELVLKGEGEIILEKH